MKVSEVPQDLKYLKGHVVRDMDYAVDSDGKYQMVTSDGWEAKNDVLELALEEDKDKEERSRMEVKKPVDFHGFELDISHQPAAHCENGSISSLLRYHGINLSEPMIFGLASGLYFAHLPFIKLSGYPVTAFRSFPGILFKRITRQLNIKTETHRFLIKEHAMQELDKILLEQQRPVGCVVGMYDLPYMPPEYRFHFNGHNICIIGKDEQAGIYSVLDSNATQKVTISCEDLRKVRFAKNGAYPLFGQMYWIKEVPQQLPDLKPMVLQSIHKTCYCMLKQPGPIPFVGMNGIFYLAESIRHWEEKMGRRTAMLHLAQVIRMSEEIGTGGAGFRFIYAAFLQEAAEKTGLDVLNDYSERMTAIGDQWRMFAYRGSRFIKNRGRGKEPCSYEELGAMLKDIGEQEKQFYQDLDKTVNEYLD